MFNADVCTGWCLGVWVTSGAVCSVEAHSECRLRWTMFYADVWLRVWPFLVCSVHCTGGCLAGCVMWFLSLQCAIWGVQCSVRCLAGCVSNKWGGIVRSAGNNYNPSYPITITIMIIIGHYHHWYHSLYFDQNNQQIYHSTISFHFESKGNFSTSDRIRRHWMIFSLRIEIGRKEPKADVRRFEHPTVRLARC